MAKIIDLDEIYEQTDVLHNYSEFTEREIGIVKDCLRYTVDTMHGVPAHNIQIIVTKMLRILNVKERNDQFLVDTHSGENDI